MTKPVRKIERPTITALGGAVWVPMAVRSIDRTTVIRTKLVTMIRMEGATDSTVISAISWMTRSLTPEPWPRLIEMS